jgi:hypothetical protein
LRRVALDANAFRSAWEGPAFDQIEAYLQSWDVLAPRLKLFKRGAMSAKSEPPPATNA